jgi:tetratricopeptide (TPR) repeat protein
MMLLWLVKLTFMTPFMERSTLKSRSSHIALFAAIVFISHPVQTQAVTYIVQRLTCLATFFYLASLLAYVKSRLAASGAKRYVFYAASLLSALLAMNTKQIAFTLPLAISLYEFSFFRTAIRKRALFLFPLLLTIFVIPLSFIDVDRPLGELVGDMGEATTLQDIPRLEYLLTEFRVMATYIRLLVLPVNQNLDYDYPVYDSFFALPVLLSFLLLLAIFALGIFLFHRSRVKDHSSRLIAFGIFWFFLAISVESSIIPLHVIYEHRIYLPSVGLALAFSAGAFLIYERLKGRRTRATMTVLLAALSLVFGIAAHQRNNVWKTEMGLWEDVVEKSPHKARPHYNLGKSYQQWGMDWEAIKEYEIAVRLKPDYVKAHNNLGIVYLKVGRMEEAIKEYRLTIGLDPGFKEAHFNLGIAYLDKGLIEEAQAELKRTLEIDPGYARARIFLEYISKNPARR